MKICKGAMILGQSGGPTSVINASAAGVFIEALNNENITHVYAASHGIKGILNEEIFDINQEDIKELELLKTTPSSSIGSVRYKLKDYKENPSEYLRILEVFKKYDIRYFLYNGGNDSMDTCNKISKFFKENSYECYCIGIPKTIDNDLAFTDHTPGFASVAKYIATTIMEAKLDATVYDTPMIIIFEAMGRNAGWCAAAAKLAEYKGLGADLIYVPEITFSFDKFWQDVEKKIKENNGKVIIVASEGIKIEDGRYVSELNESRGEKDSFGHAQMGGTASVLASFLRSKTKIKVRSLEPSLIQRSAAHLASKVDVIEAYEAGRFAVKLALNQETDYMVGFKRKPKEIYSIEYIKIPLEDVANAEKKLPLEWILKEESNISDDFISYCLPLIQGDMKAPLEDGLPRFAKLKKILVNGN